LAALIPFSVRQLCCGNRGAANHVRASETSQAKAELEFTGRAVNHALARAKDLETPLPLLEINSLTRQQSGNKAK